MLTLSWLMAFSFIACNILVYFARDARSRLLRVHLIAHSHRFSAFIATVGWKNHLEHFKLKSYTRHFLISISC